MAKYNVTLSCGHEIQVQLFGPHKERDRRIARMQQDECPACRAAKSAEAAQAQGLPALTGSDKQIAWAASIRAELLPIAQDTLAQMRAKINSVPAEHAEMAKASMAKVEALIAETRASVWIDLRDLARTVRSVWLWSTQA